MIDGVQIDVAHSTRPRRNFDGGRGGRFRGGKRGGWSANSRVDSYVPGRLSGQGPGRRWSRSPPSRDRNGNGRYRSRSPRRGLR